MVTLRNCPPQPSCPQLPAPGRVGTRWAECQHLSLRWKQDLEGLRLPWARGPARRKTKLLVQMETSGTPPLCTASCSTQCFHVFSHLLEPRVIAPGQQAPASWRVGEAEASSVGTEVSPICRFLSIPFFITLIQGTFKGPVLPSADVFSS